MFTGGTSALHTERILSTSYGEHATVGYTLPTRRQDPYQNLDDNRLVTIRVCIDLLMVGNGAKIADIYHSGWQVNCRHAAVELNLPNSFHYNEDK